MIDLAEAYRQRALSNEALAREEAEELRRMTPEQTIRTFESLVRAGFYHIRQAFEEERRKGGDLRRLAKLLLDGG